MADEDKKINQSTINIDNEIMANIKLQIILTSVMLIAFLYLRKRFRYYFTPNTLKENPFGSEGVFNWAGSVARTRDIDLLNQIGLDSFLLLSTHKMFFRLFSALSLIAAFPLIFVYLFFSKKNEKEIFSRCSILNISQDESRLLILPSLMLYIVAFTVFYFLHRLSRRTIGLCQSFSRSYASMMPVSVLKCDVDGYSSSHNSNSNSSNSNSNISNSSNSNSNISNSSNSNISNIRYSSNSNSSNNTITNNLNTNNTHTTITNNTNINNININNTNNINLNTNTNFNTNNSSRYNIRKAVDIPNRTILATNLPPNIKDGDSLKEYYNNAGPIEHIAYIKDPVRLKGLTSILKKRVRALECSINNCYREFLRFIQQNELLLQTSFPELLSLSSRQTSIQTSGDSSRDSCKESSKYLNNSKRAEIFLRFINNKLFLNSFGSDIKLNIDLLKDAIVNIQEELVGDTVDDTADDTVDDIMNNTVNNMNNTINDNTVNNMNDNMNNTVNNINNNPQLNESIDEMEQNELDLLNEFTVHFSDPVSSDKLRDFYNMNSVLTGAALLRTRNPEPVAFITFKERRSVVLVENASLASSIFSLRSEPCYFPSEVRWAHLGLPRLQTHVRSVAFFLAVLCYALLIFGIITSLLVFIERTVLEAFLRYLEVRGSIPVAAWGRWVQSFIAGMLFPLMFNIILTITPYVVKYLSSIRAARFSTLRQHSLLVLNLNFILYIIIAGSFLGSRLLLVLKEGLAGKRFSFADISDSFSGKFVSVGALFFNTIIQRMLVGSMNTLFKYDRLLDLLAPLSTKRDRLRALRPPDVNLGVNFTASVAVFPMMLVFSVICPFILVLGSLYFLITYLLYKHELMYAVRNYTETGGRFLASFINSVSLCLVASQIITAFQFATRDSTLTVVSVLPCMFMTLWAGRYLSRAHAHSLNYFSFNKKEHDLYEKISKDLTDINVESICMSNKINGEECQYVSIYDVFDIKGEPFLYDLPQEYAKYSTIIFPDNFFSSLNDVIEKDKHNVFGFGKK